MHCECMNVLLEKTKEICKGAYPKGVSLKPSGFSVGEATINAPCRYK